MILVVKEFSALPEAVLERSYLAGSDAGDPSQAARDEGAVLGLEYQGEANGRHLVIDSGRQLERQHRYAIAPAGEDEEGAKSIVRAIVEDHGPGRWWSTGPAVHRIGRRGSDGIRTADIDGVPHVVMAAYYYHEVA